MTETVMPVVSAGVLPDMHVSAAELSLLQAMLARHLPGMSLWAYGSRVAGWPGSRGLKSHSDLDLAVLGQPSDLAMATLRADLEDSDLPWRVDLTPFDALPPSMRELIVHHGCLVLAQPVSALPSQGAPDV